MVAADGHDLPFRDAAFDASFASRVLIHARAADRVVSEMARVTRPGGRVVLSMEPDWETLVVDAVDRDLLVRVVQARTACHRNGTAGRQFRRLALRAGLVDVGVRAFTQPLLSCGWRGSALPIPWDDQVHEMVTRGALAADDGERFLRQVAEAERRGEFFAAATVFSAWGTRAPVA